MTQTTVSCESKKAIVQNRRPGSNNLLPQHVQQKTVIVLECNRNFVNAVPLMQKYTTFELFSLIKKGTSEWKQCNVVLKCCKLSHPSTLNLSIYNRDT